MGKSLEYGFVQFEKPFKPDIEHISPMEDGASISFYTVQIGRNGNGYDSAIFNTSPANAVRVDEIPRDYVRRLLLTAKKEPRFIRKLLSLYAGSEMLFGKDIPGDDELFSCSDGELRFLSDTERIDIAFEPVFNLVECDKKEYFMEAVERLKSLTQTLEDLDISYENEVVVHLRWSEENCRIIRLARIQRDLPFDVLRERIEGVHYCPLGDHWWDEKSDNTINLEGNRKTYVRSFHTPREETSPKIHEMVERLKKDEMLECEQCKKHKPVVVARGVPPLEGSYSPTMNPFNMTM
ncbi:MAG: hypothetical protein ISS36_02790 [Candidatus Aenigmarchaeota archaeon]|nr:hypothetical protein [Candidatus Aenigmarchaeota archaeon]